MKVRIINMYTLKNNITGVIMEFKSKEILLKTANKIIKRYQEGYSIRHTYFRPINARLINNGEEYIISL